MLVAVFHGRHAEAALNPAFSVSLNTAVPQIGKVSSGSVATDFVVLPTSGTIQISPVGTTSGQFIPYNSSRSSVVNITVTCTGNKCGNSGQTASVTITGTTTHTGRFGQITGLNAVLPAGLLSGGGTTVSTTGSTLTFTLNPFTGSKTISLGMSVPVATTGTLGTATSNWTASIVGTTNGSTGTGNSQAQGAVEGRLTMNKVSDLSYGTIILIKDGTGAIASGTLTWDAANQTYSSIPAGLVVQRGSTSIAAFNVSGTPGQTLHFTLSGPGLPTKLTLTNGSGQTLDITPSTTGQSGQTIPTSPTPGVFTFYVGGTVNIGPSMHTGVFSGTFTVTANYE